MSKIITVYSPRPGNGCTTIATNLAALLASGGRRVCLVDINFAFPDITFFLGVPAQAIRYTINDYLYGKCNIADALFQIPPNQRDGTMGNLSIIPASTNVGDILKFTREGYDVKLLHDGIQKLAKTDFDFILFERSGIEESVLLSITQASAFLAVTSPSRINHQALDAVVSFAKSNAPQSLIVINKAPQRSVLNFDQVRSTFEQDYGCPVTTIIPVLEKVREFHERDNVHPWQRFFVLTYPEHLFSQEIAKCAAML